MYNKSVLSSHSQIEQKWFFKTNYRLMHLKSIAECSKGSILQYFGPCIKLPHVFKTFVLSIFEWPLKTGFTVDIKGYHDIVSCVSESTFCTLTM